MPVDGEGRARVADQGYGIPVAVRVPVGVGLVQEGDLLEVAIYRAEGEGAVRARARPDGYQAAAGDEALPGVALDVDVVVSQVLV